MLNKIAKEPDWGTEQISEREEDMLEFTLDRWADTKSEVKIERSSKLD